MKTFRIVFYIVYFVFHLVLFITAVLAANSIKFLMDVFKYIDFLKYGALFGLILLLIDIIHLTFTARSYKSKIELLENEKNALKARLWDIEEQRKSGTNEFTVKTSREPEEDIKKEEVKKRAKKKSE